MTCSDVLIKQVASVVIQCAFTGIHAQREPASVGASVPDILHACACTHTKTDTHATRTHTYTHISKADSFGQHVRAHAHTEYRRLLLQSRDLCTHTLPFSLCATRCEYVRSTRAQSSHTSKGMKHACESCRHFGLDNIIEPLLGLRWDAG
jgi:hypothetical protein